MEGSRHRKHCHRVKEQVRAFSIETRRGQQEDARRKGRHPRPLRLDPISYARTGGVGVSWNFVPQWSVISEVFAIMGPGQSNPRVQSGLRYSPTKDIDWDLIYGRNLTGEGANWITVALTIRIGDN